MPKEIDLPDGSVGVFPDDMPDADIQTVLRKQFPPERGAGERFVAGLKSTTVDPLIAMAKPPDLSTGRGVVEAAFGPGGRLITHMFDKARDAVKAGQEGNWKEAAASGLEAIPVVGQVAEGLSAVGVPLAEGNVAGAAGAATGLAIPFSPKLARGTAAMGRAVVSSPKTGAVVRGVGKVAGGTAVVGAGQAVGHPFLGYLLGKNLVKSGVTEIAEAFKKQAATVGVEAAEASLLEDLAQSQAGKKFASLDPTQQATVRDLAKRIQAPTSAAPKPSVPAGPPPPPFSGNPSETPPKPATAPPARPAAPPPSPVAEEPAAPPAQLEAQAVPSEAKPPVAEPDLEAQLRESIARVPKKAPPQQAAAPEYPRIGKSKVVDGRTVGSNVPNESSIEGYLADYDVLPGIREVPVADFPGASVKDMFYAADDFKRVRDLTEQIKQSGRIDPLIVIVDKDGPYILEGGHRLASLHAMGAKSFPARIVMDRESIPRPVSPPDPAALSEAFDQPAMKEAMAAKGVKAKAIGESIESGARTLKAEQYGKLLKERGITATQAARLPKDSPFWATAAEELRNSMINSGELTWEQAERMKFKPPSARTVGQIVKMLDQ